MDTTSVSLLERLKVSKPDDADWRIMHQVYHPLIQRWIGMVPGIGVETADLVQDVFFVLTRELPNFERQRHGSFCNWLKQIAISRIRSSQRKNQRTRATGGDEMRQFLRELSNPRSNPSRRWAKAHEQMVLEKLLAIVAADFGDSVWTAFRLFALEGLSAAEVEKTTELTRNAIVKTKARILRRVREESRGFLE